MLGCFGWRMSPHAAAGGVRGTGDALRLRRPPLPPDPRPQEVARTQALAAVAVLAVSLPF